jgi:hypothetical protein
MIDLTPIAHEAHVLKRLRGEGWGLGEDDGASKLLLRTLAAAAEELRKRYEKECSYPWANTEHYTKGTEAREAYLGQACLMAGLHVYLQRDCRGVTLYVSAKGPVSNTSYNTDGVNIRPEQED